MAKGSTRQVKVYSKYRYMNRGWLSDEMKIVPWLNVSGVWLEQAGFNAGDPPSWRKY